MEKSIRPFILLLLTSACLFAQSGGDPNWTFIRTDNTGIGGQLHFTLQGDSFNNIWIGGYTSNTDEGSLVRVSTSDTVYTNWGTYSEEFLPNGKIYDIEFDATGIIWVATEGGLTTSSDGLEWQHFDTTNTPLLTSNVDALAIGPDDAVWAVANDPDNASLNGVAHFNGSDWNYVTSSTSNLPASSAYNDIAVDFNGTVWIATNEGLITYDGTNWNLLTPSNSGLSDTTVHEVIVDDQGRLWALTPAAVDIFDGTDWSHITENDLPITNLNARTLALHGDRIMITEAGNYRLLLFDGTDWTVETTNFTMFDSYIDLDGNFWVSGYGVVAKYDGTGVTRYTRNNTGLPDNFNEDIFIDSQGRRWFANGNGGIQVFDCPNWEVYGPNNEGLFPNPQPGYQTTIGTSISEDADGDIWFTYDGTSGYAIQIPGGNYKDYASWVIWDNTNSLPELQFPQEVAATQDGYVFVRGYYNNLFMFDKNTSTWSLWNMSNGLTGAPLSLAGRQNGDMYVGRYQGIDIFSNGTWSTMDLSSQGIEHVYDIHFDTNDTMWLGTPNGLWSYDGTTWTTWNIDNSNIAANNVTSIDSDPSTNTIYVSAHNTYTWPYYGGISYFDGTGNTFTTFLAADSPLAHKQVEDIAVDGFGNIWALTQSEGFSIYNPNGISGFECIDRSLDRILGVDDASLSGSGLRGYNLPNPFEDSTTIIFYSEQSEPGRLAVFDLLGRKVAEQDLLDLFPGENRVTLDLDDEAAGIYFCKLQVGQGQNTIKLVKR
jgi:ligand-binding sensor domain-containing protein